MPKCFPCGDFYSYIAVEMFIEVPLFQVTSWEIPGNSDVSLDMDLECREKNMDVFYGWALNFFMCWNW